jgi:hypothetical protein
MESNTIKIKIMKYIFFITIVLFCGAIHAQILLTETGHKVKSKDLKDGMNATVRGIAQHGKPDCDPRVQTKAGLVYIANMERWDEKTLNKKVEVSGVIKIFNVQAYNKDGRSVQCVPGRNVVLKDVVWKVIR